MTRGVRLIRFALIAAVSLFAAYVIAANVFLSTSLFERIVDGRPEKIDVRFERAWSLFPQHVHARKLTIRGRDSSVEWWLRLEEVELDISLLSLFERRFEGSHIRAKGVSFRFRQRPDAPPSAAEVASIPSIPGFPAYSVRPHRPPSPPAATAKWNDALYRLWTVHLEDLDIDDAREVWVDRTRFAGSAHVAGRFYFKPLRAVEVGPVRVAVAEGQVSHHGERIAEALGGSTIDLTLARFDPRTATGADLLSGLTLVSHAHATFPEAVRLTPNVAGPLEVRRAALRITRGRLEAGSQLAASVGEIRSEKHRVTGALTLDARVTDRLELLAELTDATVWQRPSSRPVLRAPRLIATGDARALDLARHFEDLHVVVGVPDGELLDAGRLSRYFPPSTPASVNRGGARFAIRVEAWLAEKRATALARLRADDLDFRLARMRVRGRASVRLEVGAIHFDTRRLEDAALTVQLSDGVLASTREPSQPRVRVNLASLDARARSVELADPLRDLTVSIAVPSADVVSRGLLQAYLPKGSELPVGAEGSRFALSIEVAIADHLAQGWLRLQSRALKVRHRDFSLAARLDVRARVHNWRWQTGELALDDARVELERVTMRKDVGEAPGMTIGRIGIAAHSKRFALDDPLRSLQLAAWLEDARVRDFATVNAYLPTGASFRFEGNDGTFRARLELDVEGHTATGSVRARTTGVGVGGKTVHLRGDTELSLDVVDWSFERHTLAVRDARVGLSRVVGWLGHEGGKPDFTVDRLGVAMKTPSFDLAQPSLRGSDFRLVIDDGLLPDARALAPLMQPKGVLRIESGAARVAGDLGVSHARRSAEGSLEIGLERAGIRLRDVRLSGDFRFVMKLSGFDPDLRLLDVSGTRLEMRDVAVTGATASTEHWNADVNLPRGNLRLGPAMALDTLVRLDARDARPLLAILFEDELPKIVVRLTDVPHLAATTRLLAASREVALLDLDARGGNLAVRGSYAVRDGERTGGVVVKKAFVSIGFRLDNGGAHPRLFGLDSWLRDRRCSASALVDIRDASCATR